ncbi:MAG: glycosyltransferase [Oscillospiraceae bacterium]|nr:glycosyltransferase [Oscillospiraceae bacterium]
MKKVVLLAPTPPPASGIASWTVRMLNCGLGDSWEPVVVDEKVIGKRGVFAHSRRNMIEETKRTLTIWNDLKRQLRDPDVKIVQSCIPPSTYAMLREYRCMQLAHQAGKKYIIHYRSTLPNYVKPGINETVYKRLSQKADMVFVLNGPSAEMVEKTVGKKYKLIPNFIEADAIRKDRVNISPRLSRIVYVGGVTPSKGCDLLIESARVLGDIEFRLVGGIKDSILKMDIPSNVTLVGELDKKGVVEELERADIFAFLSRFPGEGFSNALLEAMANGLPCIVTNWAANADMVTDCVCGRVLRENTIECFVEAINSLRSPDVRREMSAACISRAENHYSGKKVIRQYVDAYEELMK